MESAPVEADYELAQTGPSPLEVTIRTRLEICAFERRPVELVEGFTEIGSGTSGDTFPQIWDWVSKFPFLVGFLRGLNTAFSTLSPAFYGPLHYLRERQLSLYSHYLQYLLTLLHWCCCEDLAECFWGILTYGWRVGKGKGEALTLGWKGKSYPLES